MIMRRKQKQKYVIVLTILLLTLFTFHQRTKSNWHETEVLRTLLSQDNEVSSEIPASLIRSNLFDTKPITNYSIPQSFITDESALTYQYDPRLTRSIYMHHITKLLMTAEDINKIQVPFSWYDWVNIGDILNGFIALPKHEKFDCSLMCATTINKLTQNAINEKLVKYGGKQFYDQSKTKNQRGSITKVQYLKKDRHCSQYCSNDKSSSQPGFKVFNYLFKAKNKMKAKLQAASYLYSSAPNPSSLVFALKTGNFEVPVIENDKINNKQSNNMKNQGFIKAYIKEKMTLSINILNEYVEFLAAINMKKPNKPLKHDKLTSDLDHERFLFDAPAYLKSQKPETKGQIKFQKSLKSSLNRKESTLRKHFVEVSSLSIDRASHFDWRFYNGQNFSEEEKQIILSRMLKTWSKFTRNVGILSWLSHGGLLAYNFNGIPFPWDDDLDIQMPFQDFVKLAENYNGSLIIEDPSSGFGSYYLDLTDSITHRVYGNGLNNIDGRFIDIQSGLFIDLTTLTVSATDLPQSFEDQYKKVHIFDIPENIDPNAVINDLYAPLTDKDKKILEKDDPMTFGVLLHGKPTKRKKKPGLTTALKPQQKYDVNYQLKAYNCRNEHFYQLQDLSPLRLTYFDQVPVYVPNKIQKILSEEYVVQPLLSHVFNNFVFLPQLRIWVPLDELKKSLSYDQYTDPNMYTENDMVELLQNEYVAENFRKTFRATLLNEKENFIMKDNDIKEGDKISLLEGLLLDYNLGPISKDLFSYKIEKSNQAQMDLTIEYLQSLDDMKKQVHQEYNGNNIDYSNKNDIDYNLISWTYKKILDLYQQSIYDPDLNLKIKKLEKSITSTKNKEFTEINKKSLEKLMNKQSEIAKLDMTKHNIAHLETMLQELKSGEEKTEIDELDTSDLLQDE